jgi:hypothetical protein
VQWSSKKWHENKKNLLNITMQERLYANLDCLIYNIVRGREKGVWGLCSVVPLTGSDHIPIPDIHTLHCPVLNINLSREPL